MDGPGGSKPRPPRKQVLTPRKDPGDLDKTPRPRPARPSKVKLNDREIQELVMDSDSTDDMFGDDEEDEPVLRGLYSRGDNDAEEEDHDVEDDAEDGDYDEEEDDENYEEDFSDESADDKEEEEEEEESQPLPDFTAARRGSRARERMSGPEGAGREWRWERT